VTTVDLQFSPAASDWPALETAVRAADHTDFGAIWVFDHLAGVSLGGSTMIECFTLLGAIAAVTERIELGTMVANVWNRQVGTLVTAAASVALVSGRQYQVGTPIEPSLERRQSRVSEVLELAARAWSDEPDPGFETFPRPVPRPTCLVGVNSIALSRLAGRCADGINVRWNDPRRDAFLAAADEAAEGRPFVRTAYASYDEALLDPDHPERRAMERSAIDRLILAQFGPPIVPG
jgi:alkanesulfonate monooxygenase SsuD/methylene tetrahydromethanopterin reductase-like flavin-dependent oxidoreductase (luciferase family)